MYVMAVATASFLDSLRSHLSYASRNVPMAALRVATSMSRVPDHVPAPWRLKADMYWLVLRLSNPLPPETYHPLDTAQYSSPASSFKGGFGMIQVIRYSESPVGPYDELMIIPGEYEVPGGEQKGRSKVRVSRIYVSQMETCFNGSSCRFNRPH